MVEQSTGYRDPLLDTPSPSIEFQTAWTVFWRVWKGSLNYTELSAYESVTGLKLMPLEVEAVIAMANEAGNFIVERSNNG